MPVFLIEGILEDDGVGSSLPTKDEIQKLGYTYLGMPCCIIAAQTGIDLLTLGYTDLGMPLATQAGITEVNLDLDSITPDIYTNWWRADLTGTLTIALVEDGYTFAATDYATNISAYLGDSGTLDNNGFGLNILSADDEILSSVAAATIVGVLVYQDTVPVCYFELAAPVAYD